MIPLVLFQVIAQALLLWVFYWAATAPSPDTQGYVFYDESHPQFVETLMVEVLVAYGLVVAVGVVVLGFLEGWFRARWVSQRDTLTDGLYYLSYAAYCLFLGVVVGVVLVTYLLLSWFFGDGCLPIYGGTCEHPKSFLPYLLFYVVPALGFLAEGIAAY